MIGSLYWKSLDEVRKNLVSNVKLCNFSLQRNRIDLRFTPFIRLKSIEMYKLGWMNPILVNFFLCEYEKTYFHVTLEYPAMKHSQYVDWPVSYEWTIILEKWGRLDLTVFHLIHMSNWHLWQLKKIKSWGPFWSYQLNSTANSAHLAHFMR